MVEPGVEVGVACVAGGGLDASLEASEVRHVVLKHARWNPLTAVEVARIVRGERVEVVDAHNVHAQLWMSLAALTGRIPRLVATVHSEYRAEALPSRRGLIYEQVLRVGDAAGAEFVAVSRSVAAYLGRVGIAPDRVHCIPNGVSMPPVGSARAEVRAALGVGAEAPMVVVVARLIPAKGHDVLLDAAAQLVSSHPDLAVVCVGAGEARRALVSRSASLGLGSAVRFLGFRPDAADIVAAADVCCLPSLTEGLPFALLEAATLGVPIVASAVGESPGLFRDGREALLVRPGDAGALADALDRVLGDQELAGRLAGAARGRVAQQADAGGMVDATACVYLMSSRCPVRRPWRNAVRILAERTVSSPGGQSTVRFLQRRRWARDQVAVLTYHRVAPGEEDERLDPRLRSADVEGFRAQMVMLGEEFNVIAMDELLRIAGGATAPERAVVVTFDDAYLSVAEHAWPVLRDLGLPAAVFVPTSYPDGEAGEFWWDRLYRALRGAGPQVLDTKVGPIGLDGSQRGAVVAARVISRWVKSVSHARGLAEVERLIAAVGGVGIENSVADWATLRRLHDEGMCVAPHGRVHAVWPLADDELFDSELEGARADLIAHVGTCPPVVAYPNGSVTAATRQRVAAAGYELAFSTIRGLNRVPSTDWLMIRRLDVNRRINAAALRALLYPMGSRAAAWIW
jgi:glycosyltransferase involved in cell wall biosynthesis/peptidoglycan/xylan/chitin deacetylase (PgdA/CDA1 family)